MVVSRDFRVSIEAEGAAARPAWEDLVAQNDDAPLSKTPEWIDVISSAAPYSDSTLLLRGRDGRRFVLPRLRRTGAVAGLGMFASPPDGWDLGGDASGLLGEGSPPSVDEVAALLGQVGRIAGLRTRVAVSGAEASTWDAALARTVYCAMRTAQVLDLGGGFARIWSDRFTSKVRSSVRKAERRGVRVESDDTGRLIPIFDSLYRKSVDRWARQRSYPLGLARWRAEQRNPQSKFAVTARAMRGRCTIWVATRDGEPIAGIIVLRGKRHATYWRGAMDKELARGTGANELLHCRAIEDACAREQLSYNFGLYQNLSLKAFKATFGAADVPVRTYYFEKMPASVRDTGVRARAAAKSMVVGAVRAARSRG